MSKRKLSYEEYEELDNVLRDARKTEVNEPGAAKTKIEAVRDFIQLFKSFPGQIDLNDTSAMIIILVCRRQQQAGNEALRTEKLTDEENSRLQALANQNIEQLKYWQKAKKDDMPSRVYPTLNSVSKSIDSPTKAAAPTEVHKHEHRSLRTVNNDANERRNVAENSSTKSLTLKPLRERIEPIKGLSRDEKLKPAPINAYTVKASAEQSKYVVPHEAFNATFLMSVGTSRRVKMLALVALVASIALFSLMSGGVLLGVGVTIAASVLLATSVGLFASTKLKTKIGEEANSSLVPAV